MNLQGIAKELDPYLLENVAFAGTANFPGALSDNLPDHLPDHLREAKDVLAELASVFFPIESEARSQSQELMEGRKPPHGLAEEAPDLASRYRILVEQIPAVVFMAFLDKGISEAYVSPQIETMLGFTQEEWINDPVRWYRQIHPEDKGRWSLEASQMFLSGEPLRSVYRVLARDGHAVWFHCEVRMVRRADGRPWFIHGVGFDVTELKQTEADLTQARAELEQRVLERTNELARANAELRLEIAERRRVEEERAQLLAREQEARQAAESANRLKDDFLTTVSHELRTPLTAIVGWTEMLRDGALDPAAAERALLTIERNAKAQVNLVNDLLDASRIVTGKLQIEIRPVELITIVEAAVDTLRPAVEAKDLRLQMVLQPWVGPFSGDHSRLQQIISNLISNAIKFTPPGGMIEVRLERRGDQAAITVSDTGQGIRPEFLPHVFDRFRQADGSTTRTHGGLGLGLAIVKHLVEMHGGTIQADSRGAGHGASFVVTLPLAQIQRRPVADGQAVVSNPRSSILSGVRVLVVDDEADAREVLAAMLQRCSADVRVAASVAEGLAIIPQWRPDVLVSDIGMPGEDGYMLIRKLRSLPLAQGGQIPALALTAHAGAQDRQLALASGYQNHLAKPIKGPDLSAAVVSLVGRIEEDPDSILELY